MAITALTSPAGSLALIASNWIVARAVCPSGAVIGGETEVTDGSGRIAASARLIRVAVPGARTGPDERNTTWAWSPAWAGNRRVRRS